MDCFWQRLGPIIGGIIFSLAVPSQANDVTHMKKAFKALEHASSKARSGDSATTIEQLDEAKQHAIADQAQHPFHLTSDAPSDEKSRRHHVDQALKAISSAKASANSRQFSATKEAIRRAKRTLHLEQHHHR